MLATECPTKNQLQDYLAGKLHEEDSNVLEKHLGSCASCEEVVEALESISENSDSIVDLLQSDRNSGPLNPKSDEPIHVDEPRRPPSRSLDWTPSTIASYELLQQIGSGGMGAVYLARHQSLDKEVALKLLPALPGRNPELVARFQREIKTAGKLDHPAIVRTTDAGEERGIHFLVMDAIQGLDLSRIGKSLKRLSISDACEVARQTAIGLTHAHELGIVHRDIKPSNIMLDEQGQVRILDFGLAQMGLWESTAELTSVGQLMGTLDYMSPEQAERGGAVDYRADLYSLGATLFRLLTGRAPLAAAPDLSPLEKLRLLATHSAPRLSTLREDAPEDLCQLVGSLLSRNPSDRPASAAHVAEQLEPYCSGSLLAETLEKAREGDVAFEQSPAPHLLPTLSDRREKESAPSKKSRWQRVANWITAIGILSCLIFGALFVIETSKGQLVIESEVATVKVRVQEEASGNVVSELTIEPGAKVTRLRSGKYEIIIDAPSDRFEVSQNTFTIQNGQTVVARVTKKQTVVKRNNNLLSAYASPTPTARKKKQQLTYEGKTLDSWLQVIQYDRSPGKLKEAWSAVKTMASPKTKDQIAPVLSKYMVEGDLGQGFVEAFNTLPKTYDDDVWDALVSVLEQANPPRQKEILKLLGQSISVFFCKDETSMKSFLDWATQQVESDQSEGKESSSYVTAMFTRLHFNRYTSNNAILNATFQWLKENRPLPDKSWLVMEDNGLSGRRLSNQYRKAVRDKAIQLLRDLDTKPELSYRAATILLASLRYGNQEFTAEQKEFLAEAIDQHLKQASASIADLRFNFQTDNMDRLFPEFERISFAVLGRGKRSTHPLIGLLSLASKMEISSRELQHLTSFHEALAELPIGDSQVFGGMAMYSEIGNTINASQSVYWENKSNRTSRQQITFERQILYAMSGKLLGKTEQKVFARFFELRKTDIDYEVESVLQGIPVRDDEARIRALAHNLQHVAPRHKELAVPLLKQYLGDGSIARNAQYTAALIQWLYKVDPERFLANFVDCCLRCERKIDRELLVDFHFIGREPGKGLMIANVDALLNVPVLNKQTGEKPERGPDRKAFEHYQLLMLYRNLLCLPDSSLSVELQDKLIARLEKMDLSNNEFWLREPAHVLRDVTPEGNPLRRVAGTALRREQQKRALRLFEFKDTPNDDKARAFMALRSIVSIDADAINTKYRLLVAWQLREIMKEASAKIEDALKLRKSPWSFSQLSYPAIGNLEFSEHHGAIEQDTVNLLAVGLNIVKPLQLESEVAKELKQLHDRLSEYETGHLAYSPFTLNGQNWSDLCQNFKDQPSQLNRFIAFTLYLQTGELLEMDFAELLKKPERDMAFQMQRIAPGDVLAVYIPGVLPAKGNPPVLQAGTNSPVMGYPVNVSAQGKLKLPSIDAIDVKGKEIPTALEIIKSAYKGILRDSGDISMDFLMRARAPMEIRNVTGSSKVEP